MKMKTLNDVRHEGVTVLTENLGPVDTIRFLQQFDTGHGNYTTERKRIVGKLSVADILRRMKSRRK